jgi:hypothetical protein
MNDLLILISHNMNSRSARTLLRPRRTHGLLGWLAWLTSMSEKSATRCIRSATSSTIPTATAVRPLPKLRSRATQDHRRAVIIASITFFALALAVTAVVTTQFTMPTPLPLRTTDAPSQNDFRSAAIVTDSLDGKDCQRRDFDNQTGRITETAHCNNGVVLDSNGVAQPIGTIHRLDGISKSFLGR